MADGEARHRPRLRLPARAARVAARRVEAQAGDGHERVAGVGVDRHPAPAAGPCRSAPAPRSPSGCRPGRRPPARRRPSPSSRRRVSTNVSSARRPWPAAVDVGLARDRVGGVDDGRHARRRGRRDRGQAARAQSGGVDRAPGPRSEGLLELALDLGVGRGPAAAAGRLGPRTPREARFGARPRGSGSGGGMYGGPGPTPKSGAPRWSRSRRPPGRRCRRRGRRARRTPLEYGGLKACVR